MCSSDLLSGDSQGPIGLSLASARGKNPVHRLGDKLNVLVQLDRDAWLYCFYQIGRASCRERV